LLCYTLQNLKILDVRDVSSNDVQLVCDALQTDLMRLIEAISTHANMHTKREREREREN